VRAPAPCGRGSFLKTRSPPHSGLLSALGTDCGSRCSDPGRSHQPRPPTLIQPAKESGVPKRLRPGAISSLRASTRARASSSSMARLFQWCATSTKILLNSELGASSASCMQFSPSFCGTFPLKWCFSCSVGTSAPYHPKRPDAFEAPVLGNAPPGLLLRFMLPKA
jgi:hypothetical protein